MFEKCSKPYGIPSKKCTKKKKQHITLRKFIDDEAMHVVDKEIIEEIILPNLPEEWHAGFVKNGNKTNSPIKEIVHALENFKEYERTFETQEKNGFRKNITIIIMVKPQKTYKIRNRQKICAESTGTITSGNIAARTQKIKNEENNSISDDDSS